MQDFHALASKAKVGVTPLVTGGSWKKSPVTTSCDESSVRGERKECSRTHLQSSKVGLLAKRTGDSSKLVEQESIDHRDCESWVSMQVARKEKRKSPSSMTRTSERVHFPAAIRFLRTLAMSCSAASTPIPIPAKEWIVVPPTLQAAIPVEAVTATASDRPLCLRLRAEMISRRRTDFPVPARCQNYESCRKRPD